MIAGVLPDGKADAIKRLQSRAQSGDGWRWINDAPALARADVGIAMGGGSENRGDHPDAPVFTAWPMRWRFRKQRYAMKQNLLGAFVTTRRVRAGILRPLTGTLLNPVVAGAAMALSSITVVSNANRLLRFKPKE